MPHVLRYRLRRNFAPGAVVLGGKVSGQGWSVRGLGTATVALAAAAGPHMVTTSPGSGWILTPSSTQQVSGQLMCTLTCSPVTEYLTVPVPGMAMYTVRVLNCKTPESLELLAESKAESQKYFNCPTASATLLYYEFHNN